MHQRQAIREATISTLTSGVPLVGGRIFSSRVFPMDSEALPGICVYTTNEVGELVTTARGAGFRDSQRETALRIEIYVKGKANIDDEIDDICSQVETAMGNNIRLNDTVTDQEYQAITVNLSGDNTDDRKGEKTGVGTMVYQCLYFVPENDPEF